MATRSPNPEISTLPSAQPNFSGGLLGGGALPEEVVGNSDCEVGIKEGEGGRKGGMPCWCADSPLLNSMTLPHTPCCCIQPLLSALPCIAADAACSMLLALRLTGRL